MQQKATQFPCQKHPNQKTGGKEMKKLVVILLMLVMLVTLAVPVMAKAKKDKAAPAPAPVAYGNYVASKTAEPFHLPSCKWVQKISKDNIVYYKTKEDAIKDGHRPCKVCKP